MSDEPSRPEHTDEEPTVNQTNTDRTLPHLVPVRAFLTIADFTIHCPLPGDVGKMAEADVGMNSAIHAIDEDVGIQTMSYEIGNVSDAGERRIYGMEFYVRADPDLTIEDIEGRLRARFGERVVRVGAHLHDHDLHDWEIVRQDGETRLRGLVLDAETGIRTPVTTAPVDPEDRYDEYRVIRTGGVRYRLGDKASEPVGAPPLSIPADVLRSTAETHPEAIGAIVLAVAYDHAERAVRPHMIPGATIPDDVRRNAECHWDEGGPSLDAYEAPDRSFRIVFSDLSGGQSDCYVILPDGPTLKSADVGYEAFRVLGDR